jgi:hypothetical protein
MYSKSPHLPRFQQSAEATPLLSLWIGEGAAKPPIPHPPLAGSLKIYAKTTVDCSPDSSMGFGIYIKQVKISCFQDAFSEFFFGGGEVLICKEACRTGHICTARF